MSLYRIDEVGEIDLQSPLILTVPELQKIATRLRRCSGDADGRRKKQNKQELGYIFYIADWTASNHVAHLELQDRHNKACLLTGLGIDYRPDNSIQEGIDIYAKIQREFSVTSFTLITLKQEIFQAAKLAKKLGNVNQTLDETLDGLIKEMSELKSNLAGNADRVKQITSEVQIISTSIADNITHKIKLIQNVEKAIIMIEKMEEQVKAEIQKGLKKLDKSLGNRENPEYQKRILNGS